jgi:hypothetical protein
MEVQDGSYVITQNQSRRNYFDYDIRRDDEGLLLEVNFYGMVGQYRGESADEVLDVMRSILKEYESKALVLDFEEGNHE